MKKLHYEIDIAASRERIWGNIIKDKPYRQWTEPFTPGSYFEGSWEKGSKIKFLVDQNGVPEGIFSEVAENKPYEFISLKHLGLIKKGVIDTESDEAKNWTSAYENYTLGHAGDKTRFTVDIDIEDAYESMFSESWPKALRKLKEISEKNV